MSKNFRFYNDAKTVDAEYITDGLANHETFFLTEVRSEDSADIVAGLDLEIQAYTETELTATAVSLDLTLEKWNDGAFIEYLNSDNNIVEFSFPEETPDSVVIDATAKTVDIEVVNGTVVTALVATFLLSVGASADVSDVAQVSGTTANNFTSPVVYTITSAQGVEEDWTVTVTVAAP